VQQRVARHKEEAMKRSLAIGALMLLSFACTATRRDSVAVTSTEPPPPAFGSGSIAGRAVDRTGPIPGTTVTLFASDGTQRGTGTADANGSFQFVHLGAGSYSVRFDLAGFNVAVIRASVRNGVETRVDGMMSQAASEQITVTAAAPASVLNGASVSMDAGWQGKASRSQPPPPPVSVPAGVVGGVVGGVAGGIVGGTYAQHDVIATAEYAHVQEHDFVETKSAATTTFSIDVDRASYANVRRFLTNGMMPPLDAVRVEEMINYFHYAYPQPAGSDPFSITTEVAGCPWNPAHRLARIGIQGRNLEEWRMAPNNLVFLLDVSGSMSPPARLPLIKSAFRLLVDRLRAEDSVAIVVYAGAAGVVLPPTSGADKATILAALDRLQSGGSTAGAEGIELAYNLATTTFKTGGNNRVILATDGDFNVGPFSLGALQQLIESRRKSGVFLSTIGVGDDNYRDSVLELLADKGNGNYNYLDNPKEAEKVFRSELTGTLVAIAKDVKVQLEFDPSRVASYRQIGYENRALANRDFEDDTKDAGELGAGHSVTALYEIVPAAGAANGAIATVKLRYKQPNGEQSQLLTATMLDSGTSAYAASADMQFAAAIAELGMLLRNSAHKGTASYADVAALARVARGADLEGYREELLRLVDTSSALSGEGGRVAKK
jgi:Ca-activated chloride channel homolog